MKWNKIKASKLFSTKIFTVHKHSENGFLAKLYIAIVFFFSIKACDALIFWWQKACTLTHIHERSHILFFRHTILCLVAAGRLMNFECWMRLKQSFETICLHHYGDGGVCVFSFSECEECCSYFCFSFWFHRFFFVAIPPVSWIRCESMYNGVKKTKNHRTHAHTQANGYVRSECMYLTVPMVNYLSAYANAITASLTNCNWSSNAVVFFCNFSLVVHIFLYFLLYGVSELFGYLHSKWSSQNSGREMKMREKKREKTQSQKWDNKK